MPCRINSTTTSQIYLQQQWMCCNPKQVVWVCVCVCIWFFFQYCQVGNRVLQLDICMLAKRFELVICTYPHAFAIGSPREVNGQKEHSLDQDVHVLDFVIQFTWMYVEHDESCHVECYLHKHPPHTHTHTHRGWEQLHGMLTTQAPITHTHRMRTVTWNANCTSTHHRDIKLVTKSNITCSRWETLEQTHKKLFKKEGRKEGQSLQV